MTNIRIWNSLKNEKQLLSSVNSTLNWYVCGPTVYDYTHLGHARAYICTDVMRRIISRYGNFKTVNYVLGLTDVDDKIVAKAETLGVTWQSIAQKYETDFFLSMNKLRVLNPAVISRVSENINTILEFINILIDKGVAYKNNKGVYFSTDVYERQGFKYGIFSAPSCSQSYPEGGNVDKKNIRDFALWKFMKAGWKSPWGVGRPGWHIECSANVSRWLGPSIDIHSGGIDLKFPHHENEIAQSCARHDNAEWCKFFIHTGHVMVNGQKMSKSLKNSIFLKDLFLRHGYEEIRLFCLSEDYANPLRFTEDKLQYWRDKWVMAQNVVLKVLSLPKVEDKDVTSGVMELINKFNEFKELTAERLCDDFSWKPCIEFFFNTLIPKLNEVTNGLSSISTHLFKEMEDSLMSFLNILGISHDIIEYSEESSVLSELLHYRSQMRKFTLEDSTQLREKILKECDNIRLLLKEKFNISIKDESISKSKSAY